MEPAGEGRVITSMGRPRRILNARWFSSWGPFLLVGFFHSTCAFGHGLEISGGIHTNLDSDHREIFGNASIFSLAYSAPLTPRDVHLIVEISYGSNSGNATWPADPSFELPESRYWFVPIVMGIRTNLVPERSRGPLGLYLGFGIVTLFTGFEGPLGVHDTATSLGAMAELRPQLNLNPHFALWVRERINVATDASYTSGMDMNYSGAALQIGISLGAS